MVSILLDELEWNDRTGPHRFFLDSDSGVVTSQIVKPEEQFKGTSGIGQYWWIGLVCKQLTFIALYLQDRSLILRLKDKVMEVNDEFSCERKSLLWPLPIYELRFQQAGRQLTTACYIDTYSCLEKIHPMEWIFQELRSPTSRKAFIYMWAASRAGKKRRIPKEGLTHKYLATIDDPFSLDS